MTKIDADHRIKPLQRAMAIECAVDYCKKHGLSLEKLKTQRFETVTDMIVFAQPTGVKPDGLRNDIATRPYPTLAIRLDKDGKIRIESTEYTRRYLAN